MADYLGSVPERLARNVYETDEEFSHIEVNQEIAKATGTGKLLVRVCPAHVYAEVDRSRLGGHGGGEFPVMGRELEHGIDPSELY